VLEFAVTDDHLGIDDFTDRTHIRHTSASGRSTIVHW
jgi:hypothetical protein